MGLETRQTRIEPVFVAAAADIAVVKPVIVVVAAVVVERLSQGEGAGSG